MSDTVLLAGRPVHRMGFGAMQLPGPGVFGPPKDRDAALSILRRAVEAGVDHIDTAQFYGPDVANELIHSALHPYPENLVIVSKVGGARDDTGGWIPADRPEELRAGIEANLASLELDQIPVVNLRVHPGSPVPFEDQLGAMAAARDDGLIAGVGLSTVSLDQYTLAQQTVGVACVQNAYNLFDRSDQAVLNACDTDGIPYVPYFPLGSAFFPENPVLSKPAVIEAAASLSVTPAQVALAWYLHISPTLLLIAGTSSLAHLEENLAAAELRLDESMVAAIG
jgi:aryl-alcohol dehydrogenase-like predicted oxidoreductase